MRVATRAAATHSIIFLYCGSMLPGARDPGGYCAAGISVTIVERSIGKYFRSAS